MAERVTLTKPITKPAITGLALAKLTIDVEARSVYVEWRHDDGTLGSAAYPTPLPAGHEAQPTGEQLFAALNTANLTSNSLIKRIYQRLVTDGYIAGTITGAPD